MFLNLVYIYRSLVVQFVFRSSPEEAARWIQLLIFFRFLLSFYVVKGVVQGMISELESQGALPSSNSRVSSLATCCGPRC
ncbi:hypothetical protein HanPI659440_Chr00c12g0725671 [Helianthus annuus]|nr:hypothetical protein HanPI659440_Chr00c12g0725671 [Helianthus annuus]